MYDKSSYRNNLIIIAGQLFSAIYLCIQQDGRNSLEQLKTIICQYVNPLTALDIFNPFQIFDNNTLIYFPDRIAEDALDNRQPITFDSISMVSLFKGQLYLKWTLPTAEKIKASYDMDSVVTVGLIILEEFLHISQMLNLAEGKIKLISIDTELSIAQEKEIDRLLETDINIFLLQQLCEKGIDTSSVTSLGWFFERLYGYDTRYQSYDFVEFTEMILGVMEKNDKNKSDLLAGIMKHMARFEGNIDLDDGQKLN